MVQQGAVDIGRVDERGELVELGPWRLRTGQTRTRTNKIETLNAESRIERVVSRQLNRRTAIHSKAIRTVATVDQIAVRSAEEWRLRHIVIKELPPLTEHVADIFGAHHSSAMDPQADESWVGQLLAGDRAARHQKVVCKVGTHHSAEEESMNAMNQLKRFMRFISKFNLPFITLEAAPPSRMPLG